MSYPGSIEDARRAIKMVSPHDLGPGDGGTDQDGASSKILAGGDGGGGLKGGGIMEDLKPQHWSFTNQPKRRTYGLDS